MACLPGNKNGQNLSGRGSAWAEIKKALTKSDFIRNEDIRIVQAPRSVLLVLTERSY